MARFCVFYRLFQERIARPDQSPRTLRSVQLVSLKNDRRVAGFLSLRIVPILAIVGLFLLCNPSAGAEAVAGDQCSGALSSETGTLLSATGCGVVITVTAVDSNGNATAATITTPVNGNPYDGTEDTLVGLQNNSGATLNSITILSSNTTFGGLFAFDGDGPCKYNGSDCYGSTGYEGPDNTFTNISSDYTSGTVSLTTGIPNGGSTWFALEGSPQSLSVVTQQGNPITPSSGLTQSFVFNPNSGTHLEADFDYHFAENAGTLQGLSDSPVPYVSGEGISPADLATVTNGTTMADAVCLLAAGQTDTLGAPQCFVSTLGCKTSTSSVVLGESCPSSTERNIIFAQLLDLVQSQLAVGGDGSGSSLMDGTLIIPPHYAPVYIMGPDALGAVTPGQECTYPTDSSDPLNGQLCPRSILTGLYDNTPKPPGGTSGSNSTFVFMCCAPEWQTQFHVPLWSHTTSVPISFTSTPPAAPPNNNNNFHAAQGAFVTFGAEPHGVILDTTLPLPAEQNANNPIPCPAPPTTWSAQIPAAFSGMGTISQYDNNGTVAALAEGAYDAHYFSVDCDDYKELVYPNSLNVTPGPPGGNVATFETVPFNIDLTPPTTSVALSSPGGYYALNSPLTATVTCTDPSSPTIANFYSGIATCAGQAFGGQQSVTPVITLNTSSLGPQTFTASATDVAGNSSAPVTVNYQVVGSADLGIGMIGNLAVRTGTNLTYYIAVANNGPSTADVVTIADALPAGTTYVSSGYAIESCNFSGGQPVCSISPPTNSCGTVAGSCSIGTLPAWTRNNPIGAIMQLTVKVNAKANTTITDTALVGEANSDPNSKNNTAKWQTLVTK